jgi:hypothetical protein
VSLESIRSLSNVPSSLPSCMSLEKLFYKVKRNVCQDFFLLTPLYSVFVCHIVLRKRERMASCRSHRID